MAGGSPAAVLLRPTFGAATEIVLEQSEARVRELESERSALRDEVRKLQRAVVSIFMRLFRSLSLCLSVSLCLVALTLALSR